MANTKLSSLGGIVCVNGRKDELIFAAIADGTAKPGNGVTVIATAGATLGDIIKHDIGGSTDQFVGLLLPKYNTDCDTANVNGEICEIVVPRSGRKYNVKIVDPVANEGQVGTPVVFHPTTDGEFTVGTSGDHSIEVSAYCATVSKALVSGDLFAEVIWRA